MVSSSQNNNNNNVNYGEKWGFSGGVVIKNLPANAGVAEDAVAIAGSGRSPGGGNVSPVQYSCLENSMDRGA